MRFLPGPEPQILAAKAKFPEGEAFRLAVKDNIATLPRDGPTTCASAMLAGYESPFEATVVRQMKQLGGIVVGKTNMDEFGMGGHSTHSAHGPVAQERADGTRLSAGGSSGGSAVAVATGDADIALGTDTGGSVRLPAAYCGVVGYKPTYGIVSRHGVVPYANSLDTVGFLARDVDTLVDKVVIQKLAANGVDRLDPTNANSKTRDAGISAMGFYQKHQWIDIDTKRRRERLANMTFGVPVQYNVAELDPAIRRRWEDVARWLKDTIGAKVVPISLPTTKHALSAYYVIAPAEASSNLAKYDGVRYGPKQAEIEGSGRNSSDNDNNGVLYSALRGQLFGDEVKRRILLGAYTLSAAAMDNHFVQAQRVRRLVRRDFDRAFAAANPFVGARNSDDDNAALAALDPAAEDLVGPVPITVDMLLCPTAPTLPPRLDDVLQQARDPVGAYTNDVFTVPASLAGLPAVSIPLDTLDEGGDKNNKNQQEEKKDKMGLQLIGQCYDDARMLLMAECIQYVYAQDRGLPGPPEDE